MRLATQHHLLRRITALVLVLGCGGGDGGTGPGGGPGGGTLTVAAQAGSGQTATVGQAVAVAPLVRVTRGGSGVAGMSVTFAVASGGGSATGTTATTDVNGNAAVGSWTLGTAAGANTLTATVAGASGSPVTFTATGTAAAAAALAKQAGDNQQARVGVAVGVRPAVRVSDQFNNPVAGAPVVFAVASGGGSLTGANQATDANGLATVGSWTLGGTIGNQTITATVQGLPVATFTAQGLENTINPAADTALAGGTLTLTRFVVSAGRTVTVNGDLIINADSTVDIAGTLRANCHEVTVNGKQVVTITGTIDNSCTDPAADGKKLELVALGDYTLTGATVRTSGDLELTNDPTLTDADFPPAFTPVSRSIARTSHGGICGVSNTQFVAEPARAKDGTSGIQHGTNGRDGSTWTLRCRGDLVLGGGVLVKGQHGGIGGDGTHTSNSAADASGGDGGEGGKIRVLATGTLATGGATNTVASGFGGRGGDATATAIQNDAGTKAPGAKARGGKGAKPGLVVLRGGDGVQVSSLKLDIGDAGRGGHATAIGADGKDATAAKPAQAGGDADAEAGAAGNTPDKTLTSSGNVIGAPVLTGGNAGDGGEATSRAGNGGSSNEMMFPDGGAGGVNRAVATNGGNAEMRNLQGTLFGAGGKGGAVLVEKGNGGDGWPDCGDPVKPGGDGGKGGNVEARDGTGGAGAPNGMAGGVKITNAANGGHGKRGEDPGVKGGAGGQAITASGVADITNSFDPGTDGHHCPIPVPPPPISHDHIVFVTPCPQNIGSFSVSNPTDAPISVVVMVQGTNLVTVLPTATTIPPGGGQSFLVRFNCAQAVSYSGSIKITVNQGTTTIQEVVVPVSGQIKMPTLTLAQQTGPFAAGTMIPLSAISGGTIAPAEGGCASDHLHGSIVILTGEGSVGPFNDPNPSGCGHGVISYPVVPAP